MKKHIKIGTIPKYVKVDGRIKIKVGIKLKVTETYNIRITEILQPYGEIKARYI